MLNDYKVYDADSHLLMSPRMWEELPPQYAARRPRPIEVDDKDGMGKWHSGWLIDGRMQPHPFGPGTQGANRPSSTMSLPAILGFVAVIGHGMMDRYPGLKVAFLEYGAEWLFYMAGRIGHYMPSYRADAAIQVLPKGEITDYLKSGRFFVAPEAEDPLLPLEMELVGEDHVLFGSDFPHGEARENAAADLLARTDISDAQRAKMLYANAVKLFGEP